MNTNGASRPEPAVLYAAKSTEDRHGSIPDQLTRTGALATAKGWLVRDRFSDEGFSAYSRNRGPGLQQAKARAVELAARHGVCHLVALHSDRIARGAGDAPGAAEHLVEVVAFLRRHGVLLRTVEDDLFADERIGLLMAAIQGQRNAEDSRRKSESVAAGLRRRAVKRGRHLGPAPFGYRITEDGGGLEIVGSEARVIRRIFHEYLAGRGMTDIALALGRDGVRTRRGGPWRQPTISKIVRNPAYVGKVRLNGEVHDGAHEAILDPETWARVARLVAATPSRPGRPPRRRRHLFTRGLLRCALCGEAMLCRSRRDGAYDYYECGGGRIRGCEAGSVRRDPLDEAVRAYFAQVTLDVASTRRQIDAARARRAAEIEALLGAAEEEAEETREQLERVRRDYLAGELSAAEWLDLRSDLAPEAEAADRKAGRLREQLGSVRSGSALPVHEEDAMRDLAKLRAAIAGDIPGEGDPDAVNAVLRCLFDRFLFHPRKPADAETTGPVGGHYWIEPVLREETIGDHAAWLGRPPCAGVPGRGEEGKDGSPYGDLFGPIIAAS
jgi:DNA invertase Pin-like site-specific DNA recombinase